MISSGRGSCLADPLYGNTLNQINLNQILRSPEPTLSLFGVMRILKPEQQTRPKLKGQLLHLEACMPTAGWASAALHGLAGRHGMWMAPLKLNACNQLCCGSGEPVATGSLKATLAAADRAEKGQGQRRNKGRTCRKKTMGDRRRRLRFLVLAQMVKHLHAVHLAHDAHKKTSAGLYF